MAIANAAGQVEIRPEQIPLVLDMRAGHSASPVVVGEFKAVHGIYARVYGGLTKVQAVAAHMIRPGMNLDELAACVKTAEDLLSITDHTHTPQEVGNGEPG
jgi:hypothetical protein